MQVRQSQYQDDVATTGTKISIIMPAFNLERKIQHSIEAARRAVEAITQRYEIIVVDDGSTDVKRRVSLPARRSESFEMG